MAAEDDDARLSAVRFIVQGLRKKTDMGEEHATMPFSKARYTADRDGEQTCKPWHMTTTHDLYAMAESVIYTSSNAAVINKANSTLEIFTIQNQNDLETYDAIIARGDEVTWSELKSDRELNLYVILTMRDNVGETLAKAARKDVSIAGLAGKLADRQPKKKRKAAPADGAPKNDSEHWAVAMAACNNNAADAMARLEHELRLRSKFERARSRVKNLGDARSLLSPRKWFCGLCAATAVTKDDRHRSIKALSHLAKTDKIKAHLVTHDKR